MKLYRCKVCAMVMEAQEVPATCAKCAADSEYMVELSKDEAEKIFVSDHTNGVHVAIIDACNRILSACKKGVDDNLDDNCLKVFDLCKDYAWKIKQLCKAEIAGHIGKGKW